MEWIEEGMIPLSQQHFKESFCNSYFNYFARDYN